MPVWERTLMIGIRPYKVSMLTGEEFDEKHAEGQSEAGGDWWGLHTESQLTIDLRADTNQGPMQPVLSAATMMHEAIHAIWRQVGLDAWDNGALEERIICGLSPALVELFHRNSWLVPYLLKPEEVPPSHTMEERVQPEKSATAALRKLQEEFREGGDWYDCEPVLKIRQIVAEGLGEA